MSVVTSTNSCQRVQCSRHVEREMRLTIASAARTPRIQSESQTRVLQTPSRPQQVLVTCRVEECPEEDGQGDGSLLIEAELFELQVANLGIVRVLRLPIVGCFSQHPIGAACLMISAMSYMHAACVQRVESSIRYTISKSIFSRLFNER